MFKYIVAAVAALYCGLLVFGDESRRPEVARQASDDVTGLTLAAFAISDTTVAVNRLDSRLSDADAIAEALRAGAAIRADRKTGLRGGEAVVATLAADAPLATADAAPKLWYVSGTRVNLRAGPGTGNAVVGQLVLGDAAQVLGDADGWYEIRSADGALSGWVFGKFLTETKPG